MEITFIGTSSGKVSLNRFHSSVLFSLKNYNLLVDSGDGISRALISNQININSIDGILFSHLHPDHFSGLPDLVVQMKIMKRNKLLEIFIHESLVKVVKEFLVNSYLLPERIGFDIHYKTFKDDEKINVIEQFFFKAKKNSHLKDLNEFRTKYPELSMYSASFLFEADNKKIIYTSDIGSEDDLFLFDTVKPEVLISEITHVYLQKLLKKMEVLQPSFTYLTHYPDEDVHSVNEILANLHSSGSRSVILASDGVKFKI